MRLRQLVEELQLFRTTVLPIAQAERQRRNPSFTFDQFLVSTKTHGYVDGLSLVQRIMDDIDCMYPDEGKYEVQKEIHWESMNACLRPVLGRLAYKAQAAKIRQHFGWETADQTCFVKAPRKSGKTDAYIKFMAAILINVPGIELRNVAAGLEIANEFVQAVTDVVEGYKRNQQSRRVKRKAGRVVVYHQGAAKSSLTAMPVGGQSDEVSIFFFTLHSATGTFSTCTKSTTQTHSG